MKRRLARLALVFLAMLAALFVGLWLVGPRPVEFGPFAQNVTPTSFELCVYSEIERDLRFEIRVAGRTRTVPSVRDGAIHRARFDGLQPGTEPSCLVVDVKGDWRREYTLRLPPVAVDAFRGSIAVVGDSGKVPRWLRMRRFGWEHLRGLFPETEQWKVGRVMASKRPDLFVHVGDVIYSHDQFPAYQTAFFAPFAAVLAHAPAVVTLGNHDMHRWEHPEFFRLFKSNKVLDPKQRFADFSHRFDWGPLRCFVLDVFWQKWLPGSAMRSWLERELAELDGQVPVVVMHHPVFTDEAGATENEVAQKQLWPLFVRHGVKLILSGDSHNYQRFAPIDGVTQVIVGTGGKSIRPVAPKRLDHHEERFGFLLLTVTGARRAGYSLTGEFFGIEDQAPLDRFVIRSR